MALNSCLRAKSAVRFCELWWGLGDYRGVVVRGGATLWIHSPSAVGRLRAGLGVAVGQVPDVARHLEGTRTITRLRDITADAVREVIVLEEADAS